MALITIQELPTEILMQVLTLALPEDPWEWGMELVQQLALVCRRWLGLVLSTPGLWPTVDSRQSYRTIAAVLAHNPAGPLNVRLREASFMYTWAVTARRDARLSTERFVEMITPYAQRWKNIDITGSLSTEIALAIERAEATEYLQLLVIGGFKSSTQSLVNISRLDRLQSLRISGVQVQWDNTPKLPLLQILTVSFTELPPIHQLHAILESSTMLESISFHSINDYPLGRGDGMQTSQRCSGFGTIHLPDLTNIHLNMVPTEISTHLLTHLACPGPLSLAGNYLDQSVFENEGFKQLVPTTITTFQRIRVDITPKGLRVHTDNGDRLKDVAADADVMAFEDSLDLEFTLGELRQMAGVAQNLGLLVEPKRTTLTVQRYCLGSLDTIRVAWDLIPALNSIDDIWVVGGWTLDGVVAILLEKCVGELGDSVWTAPRLQYLAVQDVLTDEKEYAVSALCGLWERRYASLEMETSETSSTRLSVPCLPLHRLLVSDEWMVGRILEEGLFPELMVNLV